MRRTFVEILSELAERDTRIMLMVGDVGFSYIENFEKQFPNQYVNCGVTEQSMMGMAAGLALTGWKPYVYSMIPFITMRCYEQVRNDVCYQNANVKIIGVQGSAAYRFLGFSHNIADGEDERILGHLPNMSVYMPQTTENVSEIIRQTYAEPGPAYIRLC